MCSSILCHTCTFTIGMKSVVGESKSVSSENMKLISALIWQKKIMLHFTEMEKLLFLGFYVGPHIILNNSSGLFNYLSRGVELMIF